MTAVRNFEAGDSVSQSGMSVVVDNLRVDIGAEKRTLVGPLSFSAGRAEIVGIVGESGSGKTTTGLSLLGYIPENLTATASEVSVNGVPMLQQSIAEVRRMRGVGVSYVPQDPSTALDPALSVGRQFIDYLRLHRGVSKTEARELVAGHFDEVGLPSTKEFLRRWPFQLSGGQLQRVAIAMAFSCAPYVVVLDEPTTGLDVKSQRTVLSLIKALRDRHSITCVYITHDLALVAELADSLVVMHKGNVVESGPVQTVLRNPAHDYTKMLFSSIPDIDVPRRRRHVEVGGSAPAGPSAAPPELVRESETRLGAAASLPDDRPGLSVQTTEVREVLRVENVSASYRSASVLSDISFAVSGGECFCLIGESGSGKTTLSRVIGGLHAEADGKLFLHESELPFGVRTRKQSHVEEVSFVFQNPYSSLNPRSTVRENILRGGGRRAVADSDFDVDELLSTVSLDASYADKYPGSLSGGERQRVAIARAIASNPSLLICDEITSALDVSVQSSIVELLERLRSELNLGILFVTHDLGLVRQIADHVAVLQDGRIVESQESEALFGNPLHEYTRELIRLSPSPSRALKS